MKSLLLLLLCAFSVQSQDFKEGKQISEWKFLVEAAELAGGQPRIRAYYAPASVRRGQDYTKLWVRWDFPNGSGSYFSSDWRGPEIGSVRAFTIANCDKGSLTGSAMLIYGLDGHLIFEKKLADIALERPGSIGQLVLDSFCEREKSESLNGPPKLKPKVLAGQ